MGICKCKKRTDLFCFVHKKAVCESCIVTDHQTCVVRTYVDWLTDSDYETPKCVICKREFAEENVLRLLCLDMIHPECLNAYAASFPPHTAKAGYACPSCSKPIFPPDIPNNPIASLLTQYLEKAPWSQALVSPKIPDSLNNSQIEVGSRDVQPLSTKELDSTEIPMPSNSSNSGLKRTVSPPTSPIEDTSIDFGGIASRKPVSKDFNSNADSDDEDKYKKKGVMQLFAALGLLQPVSKSSKNTKTRVRIDSRRILIILALISCLLTVLFMGAQLTASEEPDPRN